MLTTEETKRIAKIMIDGAPKTRPKADHIIRQLLMLPDAIRVDFDSVKKYIYEIVENEKRRPRINSKKRKMIEKSFYSLEKEHKEYGASVFDRNIGERKG